VPILSSYVKSLKDNRICLNKYLDNRGFYFILKGYYFIMKGWLLKADYLDFNELLDMSEGHLHVHGRRLVLHSINAFSQFRKDLIDMVGPEQARRLLTRFGFFWGQADAAAMKRIFNWDSIEELIKAGPWLLTLSGVGKMTIKTLETDTESGHFNMEVYLHNSCEGEEHLTSVGKSAEPACWKLTGYMSGFASYCMGKSVYFIEKQCLAQGDGFCYCVGKDLESWGDELPKHLPYFEADDIKGKVESLSRELRHKTEELARHRQELGRLRWRSDPLYAEVRSAVFRRILALANKVAQFDSSVLITGETGSGKEVLARYIHRHSPREKKPFVVVNCAALPETLLESELFGHKAGSFTGAIHDRKGLLEQAQSGTIFLDEIGDISAGTQLKILRVLQEKEITRVGETIPRKIDVRTIAATNKDLPKLVEQEKFREDLLYRLRVIEIEVPPLRDRAEDILPTARYLVDRLARKLKLEHLKLDATCVDYLQAYRWPGNIREMDNALERAAVLSQDDIILPENLPPEILRAVSAGKRPDDPLSMSLEQMEAEHIKTVMRMTGNNRTKAAEILGISPSTLWRKLKTLGM